MSDVQTIQSQIKRVRNSLPSSVRLIAVTKYVSTVEVETAYRAGMRDFGESRIQDAESKIEALSHCPDVQWHLIGHLQSNKAKLAVQLFDWIHSVDSLKLAQRLNRLAIEQNKRPNICLQVKIRPDPAKFGWEPESLMQDLQSLCALSQLSISGLMVILPQGLSSDEAQAAFEDTAKLAMQIRSHPDVHLPLRELSMGMSQDYPLAIAAGATMIRLGSI
ncbi:MAG: YggS family pyridoxal phosphate-dependent enzyme, partial [Cyanobacteria bacterium P01_F01_bin.42]